MVMFLFSFFFLSFNRCHAGVYHITSDLKLYCVRCGFVSYSQFSSLFSLCQSQWVFIGNDEGSMKIGCKKLISLEHIQAMNVCTAFIWFFLTHLLLLLLLLLLFLECNENINTWILISHGLSMSFSFFSVILCFAPFHFILFCRF